MVLVNGGYLHCTDKEILVDSSLKVTPKKKKLAWVNSKIQVSDPGPSWPCCFRILFGQLKNIVEKRKNAGYQHFLLFPQCF